ncbi:uncharacterized protein LOC133909902 [Phragmites australis]|uniref:uncharacterized protein LOC133909902 n=1 Tax=Phragmites australis TaxID=29695 RepID=UPI002D781185|nr:uncharacterized protein LOC133909902 [Phragmites australis]
MTSLCMPRALLLLLLLFFFLQIPLLLSSSSVCAFVVNDHADDSVAAAVAARRRLLPVPVARQESVKLTAYPRSMGTRRRSSRRSSGSAFMNAVSKHQVQSGANPDSN